MRLRAMALAMVGGCVAACGEEPGDGPLDGPELSSTELLGKLIFFDQALSVNGDQSCAACHSSEVGWTGGEEELNVAGAVYEGSVPGRFGNRKPTTSAYAMLSPVFDLDEEGNIVGGNFWDGRATGWRLGEAATDQAQGPFLNPVEQALPSGDEVVERVCASFYGPLFRSVYGEVACSDPDLGFEQVARAVAAYEASSEVSPFSSKYDAYLAGEALLTPLEQQGLELFEGKAACAECHPTERTADGGPPAFTDHTYDNVGIPVNPENPFLEEATVMVEGEPLNPLGRDWVDTGVAAFLAGLIDDGGWRTQPFVPDRFAELTDEDLARLVDANEGKHRVPTLRNVDKRPEPGFVKAYTHNGWFKSLKGLVHFYNTRDVLPRCDDGQLTEAEAVAEGCWPAPEVPQTVSQEAQIGALGLTDQEEEAIVAFLATLTDGWSP